ncbi:hypothetical protein ACIBG8_54585 [Nonomuraea sp. NPDC050556]|uniref:hypothetical protein n=1 Tax=Nonomuraea sp. NPDC050556 TaxID=3364369 RepID=UPI0037BC235B
MTQHFLSMRQVANLLGISQLVTIQRLVASGWIIDPDVELGDEQHISRGWTRERIVAWGVETGRLAADGVTPVRHPGGRPKKGDKPPAHWRKTPARYLSLAQSAELLGLAPISARIARSQGRYCTPDIELGEGKGGTEPGFLPSTIRTWGRQTGRLLPSGERPGRS